MTVWGRPQRLRVDNGLPWGTQSPVPSALALWLVGLDVLPIYGRPARSTDNAVAERIHRLLAQWVEPDQCPGWSACQPRLAWAVETQRNRYPAVSGQTRLQAYPGLRTNPRAYTVAQETSLWQMQRVRAYLAQFTFQRKVETSGQVTLFANRYSIGRRYRHQSVDIQFDQVSDHWLFRDDQGRELRRLPSQELTYTQISQLQLGKRRKAPNPDVGYASKPYVG